MAKNPNGSSSTGQTKAGKKSGAYIEPPARSEENGRLRELGNQQFQAKEFPRQLPAQRGTWEAAMDELCRAYGVKRVRGARESDTGHRWDENRKQWIYPPAKEAVKKNER